MIVSRRHWLNGELLAVDIGRRRRAAYNKRHVVRNEDDDGERVDAGDGASNSAQTTATTTTAANHVHSPTRPDVGVADYGQQHGQPDGDGVRCHRGVDIEQQERRPAERVARVRGETRRVRTVDDAASAVELHGERHVDEHREQVGDGQRHKDAVGSAGRHVGSRQDDDVERVADDADGADHQTDVTVVHVY